MRVLSFSYCFPNRAAPTWGVFVQQRLAAVAAHERLEMVSPVPSFPVVSRFRGWPGPLRDERQGLTVHRPRFFCVPGLLKSLDGRLYARGLARWLHEFQREYQADVFDAHFEWPDAVGVSLLARELGVPYAVTLRGWLYEAQGRPRILPQCIAALRQASAVIGVSEHLAETAIELGVSRDRVEVIPNGVDMNRFQPRDRMAARRALGLPEDGRLVVSVAHLGPRKGHREMIKALANLPPDVRLVIVGGDPAGGRNERQVRELIRSCGLTQRVILAGRQSYEKVPIYFNAGDISVLASYREGCPNVVLESLASGTPVVATNVGNVPFLVQDGRNGRIVRPREVGPLTEAVGDLLGDLPTVDEVRRSPAVRSWDQVARDVCTVLRKATGQASVAPQHGPNEEVSVCR